ncbi:hypothetical protein [Rheinheimera sp. NSM]|uniref:hypothetical protein n=1 Tax=Rheinheimera sp. NSM TaxID=3457884 RepID=UPI0040353D5C
MHKFLILFLVVMTNYAHATQQIEETFIIDGDSFGLDMGPGDVSPLDSLYTFEEIHQMLESQGWCSANWRGYKGTWEVKNNQLFLTSLVKEACSENPPLVDPVLFFGEKAYPLKATWFSGNIKVRLSHDTYKYCKTDDNKEKMIGYEYEAMVYEFSNGDFIYNSNQLVKEIWEHALASCSTER